MNFFRLSIRLLSKMNLPEGVQNLRFPKVIIIKILRFVSCDQIPHETHPFLLCLLFICSFLFKTLLRIQSFKYILLLRFSFIILDTQLLLLVYFPLSLLECIWYIQVLIFIFCKLGDCELCISLITLKIKVKIFFMNLFLIIMFL